MQVVCFWGFFLFLVPPWLVAAAQRAGVSPAPSNSGRALAIAIFIAASALGLWSAYTMAARGEGTPLPLDAPRRLVIAGPYAWLRNPMALAGLAQGGAVAAWHGSWVVFAYVLAGAALWHFAARPHEEADLERNFGAEFLRYRERVPLWWPRVPRTDDAHP